MSDDTDNKIQSLRHLSAHEVKALWLELFGHALELPSRRDLVVRLLAYRLQERAYGELDAATRAQLRKLAQQIERDPNGEVNVDTPRMKPGTRLVRSWQGKAHTVTVGESGFTYQGRAYRSLSEIAREITGTRWSGPLFFGLKKTAAARETRDVN